MLSRTITVDLDRRRGVLEPIAIGAGSAARIVVKGVPLSNAELHMKVLFDGENVALEYNAEIDAEEIAWVFLIPEGELAEAKKGIYELEEVDSGARHIGRGHFHVRPSLHDSAVVPPSPGGEARTMVVTVNGKTPDENGNINLKLEGVDEIPARYTDKTIKNKINELIRKLSAIAISCCVLDVFSAGVHVEKAYKEDLENMDKIVTEVTFDDSGLAYKDDVTRMTNGIGAAVSQKRDLTNLTVKVGMTEPMNEHWTWTKATPDCPQDFLDRMAEYGAPKPIHHPETGTLGTWANVVLFQPDGRPLYVCYLKDKEWNATNITFMFDWLMEDGVTKRGSFFATASRPSATDRTPVPVGRDDRLAVASDVGQKAGIQELYRVESELAKDITCLETGKVERAIHNGTARLLPKYLYEIDFDDTYPEDAAWYCDKIDGIGYCSSVRRGNEYLRNYDWSYDESATFVVRVKAARGRFASVGVASVGTNLTEEIASSGKWSRYYKCLPGMTLDGINENGVVCNINVVTTNGSEWETKGNRSLNIVTACRWILDNATTASNAANYVAENAYVPQSIQRLGYSIHLMVADRDETWIVEDGVASNVTFTAKVMTNFRVLSEDDPYGSGYERYDILTNPSSSITNAWFTNAYKADSRGLFPWPTEFAAHGLGTHSDTNVIQSWARQVVLPKLPPKRDGKWWQTVHTSVYDISNCVLRVAVQERDDWYTFNVPDSGKVKSVNGKTGAVVLSSHDVGAIPSIYGISYDMGGRFIDEDGETNSWLRVWDGLGDGHYSAMFGYGNECNDKMSLAIGLWAKAIGEYSISLGVGSEANGYASLAVGEEAKANVGWSTALGYKAYSDSDATGGTALGYYSHTKDMEAVAIGSFSETHGQFTVSVGHSTNNVHRYAFLDPFEPKDFYIGDTHLQKHLDSTRDAAVDKVIAMKKRYAMFIIPLNDTSYSSGASHFTQFELKASTNNFTTSATQRNRCCFYSHSGHAEGFFSTNDGMRLYLNHGGSDQRSYVKIENTLEGMQGYAPAEVIVIVDAALMNPDRSDGSWLYEGNEDVVWTWVRTKDGEREFDAAADHCLWRPIAPVRWFSKLPAWAN